MMKSATAKSASAGRFQKPPKEEDDDDDAAFVGGGGSHRRPSPTEIVLSASFRDTPVEQELAASRAAFRFCPEMKLGFISLPGDVAVVFLRNAEVAALSLKPETEAFGLQGMQGPAAHRDDKQRSLRAWFGKKSKPSGQAKCVKEEAETGEEECGHDSWQDVLQKLDLLAGHREAILVVERGCAEESRRIALLQQFATLARGISVLPVLDAKGCAHFLQTMLRSISASAPGGGGATPPAGKWGRMDVEAAAFGRAFRFARAKSNRAAAEPSGARALATLPDVPPKAAEALLRRFKTVAAVLAASEEEMAQAPRLRVQERGQGQRRREQVPLTTPASRESGDSESTERGSEDGPGCQWACSSCGGQGTRAALCPSLRSRHHRAGASSLLSRMREGARGPIEREPGERAVRATGIGPA